jgi:hypothetical protein
MAMHAVIPVLFVVVVEASRHAVGRIAAITADRHMESVRLMRWLLSPVPTFRLWRRMKLWELRSYDETVRLEQNRLVYRAQLRFRYGRGWRRSAPFQALLPLKLAKYGVPLDPSILDRIDGPIEAAKVESGTAVSQVSAAVAVPTLAKLAAVRLRDAQEPAHDEAVGAEREAAALNVWMTRAVRSYAQQADEGEVQQGRLPGQMSPWFKPPRAVGVPSQVAPVAQQVRRAQPQQQAAQAQGQAAGGNPQRGRPTAGQQGVTYQSPGRIGPRPVRLEQTVQVETEQDGYRDGAQQQEAGYRERVAAMAGRGANGSAADQSVPFEALEAEFEGEFEDGFGASPRGEHEDAGESVGRGRLSGPAALDADLCFDALLSYIDSYGVQPDRQHFADYLTQEVGMNGSRPDGSVAAGDLEKIWTDLQQRYMTSGRE